MEKTDEALGGILNQLADKFGTTVEHFYGVLLKQAFIEGVKDIVGIVISAALLIASIWATKRAYKKYDNKYNDFSEENSLYFILLIASSVVFLIIFFIAGGDMIDAFFNPEYYALHQILK